MSVGQVLGTVVGGVVGFVGSGGNPAVAAQGAAIGGSLGAALDPAPGPVIEGPRLDDLTAMTAKYGDPVANINGTIGVRGQMIWIENGKMKETRTEEEAEGSKGGGGGATNVTYTYSVTCAILIADHQIDGVGRIWFGPDLVANSFAEDLASAAASSNVFPAATLQANSGLLKTTLATNPAPGTVRLYPGYDDQPVDPRMAADLPNGECPAYRGMSLLMLYDYPLARYGNSPSGLQVKVEAINSGTADSPVLLGSVDVDIAGSTKTHASQYLNQEEAVVYQVQEADNDFQRRIEYTLDSHTGNYGGYVDLGRLASAWQDVDGPTIPRQPSLWSSLSNSYFNGANGWVVYKNETMFGWSNFSGHLYFPDGSRIAEITDTMAICVDDSNNLYVLHGDVGTGARQPSDGITKYSSDGTLVEYKNISFPGENYAARATRMSWDSDNGLIYCGFPIGNLTGRFYAVDFDSEIKSDVMICPEPSVTRIEIDNNNFTVEGSILTRVVQPDFPGEEELRIERWRLPSIDPGGQLLSEVVRTRLEQSSLIEPADIDVSLLTDTVTGYASSGIKSIRSSLAPLESAFSFDLIESGYQIKAVPRGLSSVMTIDYNDLDARRAGSAPGPALKHSREMDLKLAKRVDIGYIDAARNYGTNTDSSRERVGSDAVNIETFEIPVVFTPDEIAQLAQTTIDRLWLERDDYAGTLPQTYRALEAADVVTITTPYAVLEWRLTSANPLADGRVDFTAKLTAAALYTQTIEGGQRVIGDTVIPFASKSVMHLLDIPLIRDADDVPGFVGALNGSSSGWPGGSIIRSVDSGQTWSNLQVYTSPVTGGICSDSLSAHDCFVIDRASALTVRPYSLDMEISSITEAQMMTGKNYAAYGSDANGWEIIRFSAATLNADNTITLSNFLRGLHGTEWVTGTHVDGDKFIFLADKDTSFLGSNISEIGTARLYRGVTSGKNIDSAVDYEFTYNGVNKKPLSVVQVTGSIDGSDNWNIEWLRRSRLSSSEWVTGVEIPVGEDSESYSIDIMDGATVVRTLAATTGAVQYTSADQVTDFAGNQSTIDIKIYQMSAIVGRGYVTEATL